MGKYDSAVMDRVAGVLVGTACGDALGAGYEFGPPLAESVQVGMVGGGPFGFEPGEWTDDTAMAIAIAEVAATGADLQDQSAQDAVVQRWIGWARQANDVGVQTSSILRAASERALSSQGTAAAAATEVANLYHRRTGRSGGNGALMRTAPVALAFLDDPEALATAAREISSLTHFDQDSGDACVLWSLAIRHAVINGAFDVRVGLTWLPGDRRQRWVDLIDTAEQSQPRDFAHNGWVVEAFQAAWSAIFNTAVPQEAFQAGSFPAQHLQFALEAAVRGGRDTDTVAAIAGGLLGARWGVSAVPVLWQRKIHGWPGLRQRDLVRLAIEVADPRSRDRVLSYSYLRALSTPTIHPHDEGVVLGPVNAARGLPAYVDAVVSLCRVEDVHRPPGAVLPEDQIEIWLIDSPNPADNPNLGFVLSQATDAVGILRSEGKTVFLHCAAGQSRTPTVAALTGSRAKGISPKDALAEVVAALPDACVNSLFESLLTRWPCADGAELMHPAT